MRIITVARKPLSEGTVAANVLTHGCGSLNIDAVRVKSEGQTQGGRWPANLILQHHPECDLKLCVSPCPISELEGQSGITKSNTGTRVLNACSNPIYGGGKGLKTKTMPPRASSFLEDTGSVARYFKQIRDLK